MRSIALILVAIVGGAVCSYCEQPSEKELYDSFPSPFELKEKIERFPMQASFSVDREQPLKKIEDLFAQQRGEKPVVAILGDTTKGKTELAKQYIKRHGRKYHHKWFLNAKNWKVEYHNLAFTWGLITQEEREAIVLGKDVLVDEIVIARIHNLFSQTRISGSKSLMVFDDAPEGFIEDSLKGMLPSNTDILLTAQAGTFEHRINLTSDKSLFFTEEEGIAIFRKRMPFLNSSEESEVRKIVQRFENLPVVLAQSACYLQKHPERIGLYLDLFERNKGEVLKEGTLKNPSALGNIDTYVSIFMNIQTIKKEFPEAISFLYNCTLLPHANIPKKLLEQLAQGTEKLDPLLEILRVWIIPGKETVSLHQTLQAILQEILEKEIAQEKNTKKEGLSKLGKLALDFVPFLAQNPSKAEAIYLQAIQDEEQMVKPDYLRIADLFSELASVDEWGPREGQLYEKGLKAHQKALNIYRAYLEEDHPHVTKSLNNVGLTFLAMGKDEEALKHLEEALHLRKKRFKEGHTDVADSLHNVAFALGKMEKFEDSLKYNREAYELRKKLLGENHTDVALSLHNIGHTLKKMSKHEEALKCRKESLELLKKLWGDTHPYVALSLSGIGDILMEIGKYKEALKYKKEALEIRKKVLRTNHADVIENLKNIGEILVEMGKHNEALKYQKEALELSKKRDNCLSMGKS